MMETKQLTWRINKTSWLVKIVNAILVYLVLPNVILTLACNYVSIDINTFGLVFVTTFIIRLLWIIRHPPKYAIED